MLKRKPNHYFVKTDLELLTQLFEQLENKGIPGFKIEVQH
ncbi:DNA repair protein RadC [Lactobacillus crispatus]|nr:DNA repair protein RadC [Lactobacillus crispatus]QPP17690.1 DNA repair protein RadC [Lactobacillus crispatus]